MTASEPITALDHTSVLFDVGGQQVWALQNVSLAIGSGASLSVVGKSGSGKSTLISLLALLRRPNRGRVLVRGADVGSLSDAELSALRARHVGTVFQSFHLDGAFTAQENAMMAWHFGSDLSRRAARARARHLLELVGMADLADRRSSQMSGGERQRVAIARALFGEPALLIADEPTGNLDEDTAGVIADVLFGLPQQTGTSVVVVTHDRDLANRADARIEIAHGELQPGSRSVSGPVDASLATAEAAGAAG